MRKGVWRWDGVPESAETIPAVSPANAWIPAPSVAVAHSPGRNGPTHPAVPTSALPDGIDATVAALRVTRERSGGCGLLRGSCTGGEAVGSDPGSLPAPRRTRTTGHRRLRVSIRPRFGQWAPRCCNTAGIVLAMILRSRESDHESMYCISSCIQFSKSTSLRPDICHRQVNPGLTDRRRR